MLLRVGVIGATGYTGEEIVKILTRHTSAKLTVLQAVLDKEEPISKIFPSLGGYTDLVCTKPDDKAAIKNTDLLFLALPHTVSMQIAPIYLGAGKKVIDLSADYRLEESEYKKWYGIEHKDKNNIKVAIYGLPELFREKIKKATLIANPGCYPTSAILGILPLVKTGLVNPDTIIIDSKSGATGAGRKATLALSFSEVNESIKAYKINEHQHKPEINAVLSSSSGKKIDVIFVPHLLPVSRGILSTIYMDLKQNLSGDDVVGLYRKQYKNEPFVRVMDYGDFPALRDVQNTNFCNIGIKVTGTKVVVISCIDNLLKGAAGQAVQNMNIMAGFDEREGLL